MKATAARVTANFLLFLSLAAVGCGTGEYEARMEKTIDRLKRLEKFNEVLAEKAYLVPGTKITLRLPLIYDQSKMKTQAEGMVAAGGSLPALPTQPPFMKIPGFRLCCYDSVTEEKQKPKIFFLYVGVVEVLPEAAGGKPFLPQLFKVQLDATFPGTTGEWDTITVETPEGDQLSWMKLRSQGEQVFDAGQQKVQGIYEVYIHQTEHYQFIVATRMPADLDGKTQLTDSLSLCLGTLKTAPPEAWQADPAAAGQLGQAVRLGNTLQFQPPQNFKPVSAPLPGLPPGVSIYRFSTVANPTANSPEMTILVANTPAQDATAFLDPFTNKFLDPLKRLVGSFRAPAMTHGMIGDRRFIRTSWVMGQERQGKIYCGRFEETRALVFLRVPSTAQDPLKPMEASVFTLKK